MKVVFLQDVRGTAHKGDVKQVSDGYYRNFLVPRKLAAPATAGLERQAEKMRQNVVVQQERLREQAGEVKEKLAGVKLSFTKKAKGEKLYGSVTEKDVAAELLKVAKVEVGKEQVKMEHIKTVGEHEVVLHLAEGVEVSIPVTVQSE